MSRAGHAHARRSKPRPGRDDRPPARLFGQPDDADRGGLAAVAVTALGDFQRLCLALSDDAVDEPLLLVDPPRPPSGVMSGERLRLAGTPQWLAHAFGDEGIHAGVLPGIRRLPVQII